MLQELKVANFAIIDKVHVSFTQGFNVLSGETGSGKSILLKSLALLMGEKSLADTIKTGEDSATVEGLFDLSRRPDIKSRLIDTGIADARRADDVEDLLVVKRIVNRDGRNRVYVNGSLCTLQQLREIVCPLVEVTATAPLIEMTGQHENKSLQSRAFQLDLIDQFAGLTARRRELEGLFAELEALRHQVEELGEKGREREQRLDFLRYQRDEIKSLDLNPGQENDVEQELNRLKNSHRLQEFVTSAEYALYSDEESALVRLHRVLQKGQEFSDLDTELNARLEELQSAKNLIESAVYELRAFGQDLNAEPERLESLEDKISRLRKLEKKFGCTAGDLPLKLAQFEDEILQLENFDLSLETLNKQLQEKHLAAKSMAEALHTKRLKASEKLAEKVNGELAALNMKGLIFSVAARKRLNNDGSVALTASGCTDVEFLVQPSKKDEPRPLARIASGGELSRILLSLKVVGGTGEYPRTYLFDEVDTGVSGETAQKVGKKLKAIAKGQQVICVTHLPQVAAFADGHFLIEKSASKRGAEMTVVPLARHERVREIARMLSGEKITKLSLEHAREMLGAR